MFKAIVKKKGSMKWQRKQTAHTNNVVSYQKVWIFFSIASYFIYSNCLHTLEFAMQLLKYHLPAPAVSFFLRSRHFLSFKQ